MPLNTDIKGTESNSYVSVVEADSYFSERGNTEWAALSLAQKESALIQAADYLEATYFNSWIGDPCTRSQALSWPRQDAYVNEFLLDSDSIPRQVKKAQFEMAIRASSGALIEDQGQKVIREKVDVLEVQYYQHGNQAKHYDFVSRILSPVLRSGSSGSFQSVQLVR